MCVCVCVFHVSFFSTFYFYIHFIFLFLLSLSLSLLSLILSPTLSICWSFSRAIKKKKKGKKRRKVIGSSTQRRFPRSLPFLHGSTISVYKRYQTASSDATNTTTMTTTTTTYHFDVYRVYVASTVTNTRYHQNKGFALIWIGCVL